VGWFGNLLDKISIKRITGRYMDINGGTPIFSQFGQDIYASDVVQQAVSCIAQEMKKLRPAHIRDDGTGVYAVKKGDIAKILNKPNQFQTTADFLESITTLLFLNYNVFIIPTYYEWYDDNSQYHKVYDGLYPIVPTQVDFIEDAAGQMYTKFNFENGKSYLINYRDVIHWKFRNSSNLLMGGDKSGRPNHNALLQTLALNHELLQGVSKAMKATYAVNAVVKIPTVMGKEKSENAIKELNEKLKNSESGLAAIDMKAEYIPIKKEVKLVDKDTLEFIDQKILRTFGVPLPILTGDYTKAQYEAFYQKTIEPLIISLSQVLTDKLLSDGERSHGNMIKLYPKELIFMSMSETLEMIRLVGDSGGLYENEKRTALGLMPLEELNGVRMQSLNYANVEIADKYQLGKVDGKKEA
jgi:HK97 family phage portal protein